MTRFPVSFAIHAGRRARIIGSHTSGDGSGGVRLQYEDGTESPNQYIPWTDIELEPIVQTTHSRHCYIIAVDEGYLLTMMGGWRQHDYIQLPVFERALDPYLKQEVAIPSDAIVERVVVDPWQGRQIGFIVSHPSFPEVPDGEHIPRLMLQHACIKMLRRDEDYADPSVTV